MSKIDPRLTEFDRKMEAGIEALNRELSGIRAGRASPNLLDPVKVDAYGSMMPLNQVGTVSVPEARLIIVQVWDKGLVKSVEKAIRDANLGVDPAADGQNVRVPIPAMNEQRRQELAKLAGKYAEDARIGVRNIRREAMDTLKKLEKDKEISEDELHRISADVQTMTDDHIKKIDEHLAAKQKDITQV
ncbi:MAG: ribosome recycling factor [Alphaproteobacteria bacterium]|jgi:ribosome recycling factor|nr:ribosome recycling factor [Alphaproteobacteria bacterium]